uniref:Uncharacterized protein n=1 Tax=Sciurus vulgaris TaxID=55149 RepID=A0A8D2DQ62_SCIVU
MCPEKAGVLGKRSLLPVGNVLPAVNNTKWRFVCCPGLQQGDTVGGPIYHPSDVSQHPPWAWSELEEAAVGEPGCRLARRWRTRQGTQGLVGAGADPLVLAWDPGLPSELFPYLENRTEKRGLSPLHSHPSSQHPSHLCPSFGCTGLCFLH